MIQSNRRTILLGAAALAACTTPAPEGPMPAPLTSPRHARGSGYRAKGLAAFKGIPYGADTPSRRFQAPFPPEPWTGVKECTAFGPRAPQPGGGSSSGFMPVRDEEPVSEDCLKLNIWT